MWWWWRRRRWRAGLLSLLLHLVSHACGLYETDCSATLQPGQYLCLDLNIDPRTQQPAGCTPERLALVNCTAAPGIVCRESGNSTFEKNIPCDYTNGYSLETALLLSIFLGWLGADRFYLGYPGLGLLKLCTMGFMLVGQLVDIILIATHVVKPADGSDYVVSYFGPRLEIRQMDNMTYRVPQPDW